MLERERERGAVIFHLTFESSSNQRNTDTKIGKINLGHVYHINGCIRKIKREGSYACACAYKYIDKELMQEYHVQIN